MWRGLDHAAGERRNARFYLDALRYRHGASLLAEAARGLVTGRPPDLTRLQQKLHAGRIRGHPIHAPASEIRRLVGTDRFRSYFKFCFVRNPYDRAVSDYRWRLGTRRVDPGQVGFVEFLRRIADRDRPDPEGLVAAHPDNWSLYTIDDHVVADAVGRFETLNHDLADICRRIGLPFDPATLGHHKRGDDRRDYRDWYGDEEQALVARVFAQEIAHFGYSF